LFAPWLAHEATHEAVNLRAMVDYIRSVGGERADMFEVPSALMRLWSTFTILFGGFSNAVWLNALAGVALAASWLALAFSFRRETRGAQLLFLYSLVSFFVLFWPGPIYPVNLAILMPLPSLLLGYGFDRLTVAFPRWRTTAFALFALLFVANAFFIITELQLRKPGYDSYSTVKRIVEMVSATAGSKPFVFEYHSEEDFEELASPFIYLLQRRGANVTNNADAMRFRIFHPAELGSGEPGVVFNDLKLAAFSPPEPDKVNLLESGWRVQTSAGRQDLPLKALEMELAPPVNSQPVGAIQRLSLEPHTDYLATFECRGAQLSGDRRVYILVLDAPGRLLETFPDGAGFRCANSTEWTHGSILVRTPAETARARVLLQNAGQGSAFFRSVELRKVVFKPLY
jgi:hypothetical protein